MVLLGGFSKQEAVCARNRLSYYKWQTKLPCGLMGPVPVLLQGFPDFPIVKPLVVESPVIQWIAEEALPDSMGWQAVQGKGSRNHGRNL